MTSIILYAINSNVRIKFWGTRGSIPAPGRETVKYGGNTTCVEIRSGEGTCIIIDAGTGIRSLGKKLLKEDVREIHLLITHTHWDHIQGFPFFGPAYRADTVIKIYGVPPTFEKLGKLLAGQMSFDYFPAEFHKLPATIEFVEIKKDGFLLKEFFIKSIETNHPLVTHAYRFEKGKKVFVFMTDNELDSQEIARVSWDEHVEFVKGADILVHDAQYTLEDFPRLKGWGHSSWQRTLEFAEEGKVEEVVLFHHDPERKDQEIDSILRKAKRIIQRNGYRLRVSAAREGRIIRM